MGQPTALVPPQMRASCAQVGCGVLTVGFGAHGPTSGREVAAAERTALGSFVQTPLAPATLPRPTALHCSISVTATPHALAASHAQPHVVCGTRSAPAVCVRAPCQPGAHPPAMPGGPILIANGPAQPAGALWMHETTSPHW